MSFGMKFEGLIIFDKFIIVDLDFCKNGLDLGNIFCLGFDEKVLIYFCEFYDWL